MSDFYIKVPVDKISRKELEKAKDSDDFREEIKRRIWDLLGLIIVYTKDDKSPEGKSPMALPAGSTVSDFAARIHKEFVESFKFARLWRNSREMQVGLHYTLKDGDVVELHMSK